MNMKAFVILLFGSISLYAQVYTGVATYFDGLGTPYGGCGVPQNILETQYFVALNVFNTPGVSTDYTRPITPSTSPIIGEFNNGLNCGRWVKVKVGPNCIGGINDGAIGQSFCRNGGNWVDDQYSDSELYMIVADACGDGNGWCRDSPYHLDLSKQSLYNFEKNGTPSTNMFPLSWNNRQISWEYVTAPNYSGDINIWFLQAAQTYWPAIMINHLENGIHAVEQKIGNTWVNVQRNSDMGQAFILQGQGPFIIRVYDSNNQLINGGREYIFSLPPTCNPSCTPTVTPVTYSINNPLPVSLLQFEIKDKTLSWITNSSQALFGYRILASQDGENWTMIEFIKSTNEAFEFHQFTAETEYQYYKLQCLNSKKEIVTESVLSTHVKLEDPTIEFIHDHRIKITPIENTQIQLMDLQGRALPFIRSDHPNHCEIEVPFHGIVLLQLINSENIFCTKMLLP